LPFSLKGIEFRTANRIARSGSQHNHVMTSTKVLEVIGIYRQKFEELGIKKADYSHEELLNSKQHGLEHCHAMVRKIEFFLHQERKDKAFRWLGFLQGVLWSQGIYTLEELKNHSMPDTE